MPAHSPSYLVALNRYRQFTGFGKMTSLLAAIAASKVGLKPCVNSMKAMQRWELFQRLMREPFLQLLAASDHEFRVRYHEKQLQTPAVDLALRIPFCDSSDSGVFEQIFIRKEYLQTLDWFFSIQSGGEIRTIMDIGANIGCTALFLGLRFPAANIFCLEPEATNYERLLLNIGLNNNENIHCIRGALATQPGLLKLSRDFRDGKEWGARFINTQSSGEQCQFTDAITIVELMEKTAFTGVDFLKMDIEGAEADLLRDPIFKSFLKDKVQRTAIEVHEEFITIKEASQVLASLGFETKVITEFVCGIKKPR